MPWCPDCDEDFPNWTQHVAWHEVKDEQDAEQDPEADDE